MDGVGEVTVARDLRSGDPVWLRAGRPRLGETELRAPLEIEVAVVGGGITGALVTDALLQAGMSVAVLDRRGLLRGSTPASTALLQFELDRPLGDLVRAIGRERAVRAWWASATAVEQLRARVHDLGLRCGFKERATVYLPGDVLDAAALREEAALRRSVGLRSRAIERAEIAGLTGIAAPAAILSEGAAEVDPVRLVAGLWRSAARRGCRLHAPVEVVEVEPGPRRVRLETDSGHTVVARHVVFATGYETVRLIRPSGYRVISTWAMATRPQPEALWPSRCLIWEAADPYLYLRTTPDGRIVVGGEDEPFADEGRRDALIPAKVEAIRRKARRYLPNADLEPAFAWAGCFGESRTGLPLIGAIPDAPRCWAVLGFGGNGITFSAIAARIIARALSGVPDPDAELFAFR